MGHAEIQYSDPIWAYFHRFGQIGDLMLRSDRVSEADLLLVMPNNYKRMHGLPITRRNGRRKALCKQRSRAFLLAAIFPMVEELISSLIPQRVEESFSLFADVSSVPYGK